MKKTATYLLILVSFLSYNLIEAQPFNISVPNVCFNPSSPASNTCNAIVTQTSALAPGGSYSWNCVGGGTTITPLSGSNGTNVIISFASCGNYSVFCNAFAAGPPAPPVDTFFGFIVVQCPNWLTTQVPTASVCPGSSALLKALGGVSYTWSCGCGPLGAPLNISNLAMAIVTPTNTYNTYTVTATSSVGCVSQAATNLSVGGSPTTMNANITTPNICAGSNVTVTAFGASTYTWMPPGNNNQSIMIVTPNNSTCYTVFGNSNNFCLGSASVCVTVNPAPVLSIVGNGGNNTVCSGALYNFVAVGAASYTILPGNFNTNIVTVYPTANTCYTVIGNTALGCQSSAVTCVSVMPLPILQAAPLVTVCLGSSVSLFATGSANSYTWNTGVTGPSVSVIPTVAVCYTVVGMGANGCIATAVSCVAPNNNCSDVWPGDANSDGLVDNTDVFEIGLAYNNTGTARSPGGNAYIGQFANNWTGTISTGKNKCHADCNGDGTINNGDTLAIYNNYSLTHTFRPSEASSVGDINLISNQALVNAGQWNKADITVGSIADPLNQLYGIAYDINFDKTVIVPDSIYIVYTPSFLNNATQNVNFRKTVFNSEIIHTASVRTNGANVNGNGKIGELWFKIKTGLADNTPLNLSITNAKKIAATGSLIIITGGSTALSIANNVTGIESIGALKNSINLFPNPTSKRLTLQNNLGTDIQFSLFDITGREILTGTFYGTKIIDVSQFAAGPYLIRFGSASDTFYKKLIIEK